MGGTRIDTSEVQAFASELRAAGGKVLPEVKRVVKRGAQNIKEDLQGEARKSRHFRIDRAMSYDVTDGGFGAEVGPEKAGAGNLGNIAYFGGSPGGGGSIEDPQGALDREEDGFRSALGDAAEKWL